MPDLLTSSEPFVTRSNLVLITGAGGFIGSRVVQSLLADGYFNLRCLVRPSSSMRSLTAAAAQYPEASLDIVQGNLLSPQLCRQVVTGVSVIYHLAAGIEKSYPGTVQNSVVATRNLLEATVTERAIKRFVNVSSFAVYATRSMKHGDLLTEETPIEPNPVIRGDAYSYGKVRQDELVLRSAKQFALSVAIVRPGAVFGPGRAGISGRVGIDTFGVYLHLGGSNMIPLSYVDNCADAIVLAGLKREADGQIFNVVDDDLPTSRAFLRQYKMRVRNFKSIYVPYPIAYIFSVLWEKYSRWSNGQLPPVFNRNRAQAEWRRHRFSNEKLKTLLGWRPRVPMSEALKRYFEYQRTIEDDSGT